MRRPHPRERRSHVNHRLRPHCLRPKANYDSWMATNMRIALVTDACSGIARAAALALHGAGYSLALAGRRQSTFEATAAMGNAAGGRILIVPADVSRPEAVNALFDRIQAEFGRL